MLPSEKLQVIGTIEDLDAIDNIGSAILAGTYRLQMRELAAD
jgi:hypothetical protein